MRSRQGENEEMERFSSQWQTQEQSLESFLLEQKTLHLNYSLYSNYIMTSLRIRVWGGAEGKISCKNPLPRHDTHKEAELVFTK